MKHFNWLHFTDLHWGSDLHKSYWPSIEKALIDDLTHLSKEFKEGWDVIFFTGDLVNRGSEKEFLALNKKLERIWSHLEKICPRIVLLPVPGNHDICRLGEKDAALKLLTTSWDKDNSVRECIWNDREPNDYSEAINRSFQNYTKWWEDDCSYRPERIKPGLLPGEYSYSFEKDGLKIGVIAINTAFLQLKGGNFKHKLDFHVNQIVEACGDNYYDWLGEHHAVFLLTHHPEEWLSYGGQDRFQEFNPAENITLHLCGHNHENMIRQVMTGGGSKQYRFCQSTSLFSLEPYVKSWGDGTADLLCDDRAHGFSAGRIEFSKEKRELYLWPRKGERNKSGGWDFDRDGTLLEKGKEKIGPVLLNVRKEYEESGGTLGGSEDGNRTFSEKKFHEKIRVNIVTILVERHMAPFLELMLPNCACDPYDNGTHPAEVIADHIGNGDVDNLHDRASELHTALDDYFAYDEIGTINKGKCWQSVSDIISWLVLKLVDYDWIKNNIDEKKLGAQVLRIELPIREEMMLEMGLSVEVLFSTLKDIKPSPELNSNGNIDGKNRVDACKPGIEAGFEKPDKIPFIQEELYKKVTGSTLPSGGISKHCLIKLNTHIKRSFERGKEQYYLTIDYHDSGNPIKGKYDYDRLLEHLPSLNVLSLNIAEQGGAMVAINPELAGTLEVFYKAKPGKK